jgi:tetratricopeptide (TPR) repeat protein
MSDTPPPATLDTADPDVRRQRFENAWRSWQPGQETPRWQEFLPAPGEPCSPEVISLLLHIDIEFRAKAALPALLVEHYFEHPRLQNDDARLDDVQQVELIRWEYFQRLQHGQRPRRADYEATFPRYSESLRQLKPRSQCPSCHKILVLEETFQTLHCPDCGCESSLLPTAPPFVAPTTETTATPSKLDLRGYELMETLGEGGMGEVYRCCDPALGRDLAIKVMKAELRGQPKVEHRFLREARVTGSLQHPGIVPVHNLGRLADGRLHYTMRLVRGRTFAAILKEEAGQRERLPYLLSIFEKICQAVAYAHSKRAIHRDLKPSNVMVGKFGEVQVMDWGLAKMLGQDDAATESEEKPEAAGTRIVTESDTPVDLSRMGSGFGTPAYMPVEQALGEWDAVDERADVFALGSILCDVLTGKPAYWGDGEEVYRRAKRGDVSEAFARLQQCGADAALLALCRECLSPRREDRPRDAAVVAKRVAEYQAEVQERLRQAEVERGQAEVRVREERKRRRWAVAFGVVLLVGTAFSTWQAVRATKAESKAVASEGLARNRLEQIEKANGVLASVFRDLDPHAEEKGGLDVRHQLSQHLERAASQLDEGAIGDAVTVARLQSALGQSLNGLGQARQAVDLLSKAQSTLESQLGSDHPDTLATCNNLGLAYLSAGRTAEAVPLLERTLALSEARLGDAHPLTLSSRACLADAYYYAGRIPDSIRLHEQALKQREPLLGDDHSDTQLSRNNLAKAYLAAGRTAEAIRLFKKALEQREKQLGPDHPTTLVSRNDLGNAYLAAGDIAEAVRIFEQTLKETEAKLSPSHPTTTSSRSNLAGAYLAAGRTVEAIRLFEQTLKLHETQLGADHPSTFTSRNNLAEAYREAGQSNKAIPLYEQTLKQQEAKLGVDHPDTLVTRDNLALAYRTSGRIADAIRVNEQNLKMYEAKLGISHPDTITSRNNLAVAYSAAGRIADSLRLHEQNLKQRETQLGMDHPDTLQSRYNLAEMYRKVGRKTDALRLHEQNLKPCESKLGPDHPHTLLAMGSLGMSYADVGRFKDAIARLEEAMERGRKRPEGISGQLTILPRYLASTYDRAGLFAKAEPLYRASLEEARRQFGPDDPRTASSMGVLGYNLLRQHKDTEAETLLRACHKVHEARQPDEWTTFHTRSVLGEALLDQKKYTEAEPLLLQGYEGMKQREAKIPPQNKARLTEALERLVRLYQATEQKDKAADWQKKLEETKAAQKIATP